MQVGRFQILNAKDLITLDDAESCYGQGLRSVCHVQNSPCCESGPNQYAFEGFCLLPEGVHYTL